MANKKILFISGSIGLGHVTRDLAIAGELRKRLPGLEIVWMAADPAADMLRNNGEELHPASSTYVNGNAAAEAAAKGTSLNLIKYSMETAKEWKESFEIFKKVIENGAYDTVVGDETYEILAGFQRQPATKLLPFAIIFDFIGIDSMTLNPLERVGAYMWNRIWSDSYRRGRASPFDLGIFVGERDDILNKPFGFLLPNRREWAKATLDFTGYVLPFDPAAYADTQAMRKELGYGGEPLVVCALGGTSIGRELLELCAKASVMARTRLPDLRMILVCGPRLPTKSIDAPEGVEVRGYVPELYKHFAASDLAVVQGGGTSTLELTALRKPFLYFPLQGHFEQAHIADILEKRGAGVRMSYAATTPHMLADRIIEHLGTHVTYEPIRTDGARRAAELITGLIHGQ